MKLPKIKLLLPSNPARRPPTLVRREMHCVLGSWYWCDAMKRHNNSVFNTWTAFSDQDLVEFVMKNDEL